jgi:tetratricopeptide (TPR) repeat protein
MLPLAAAVSRIAYGQALLEIGELEKAEEQLTQAAAKGTILAGVLDGLLATPMGDLRRRQWRFDEARQYYETVLNPSVMPVPAMFMRQTSADIDLLAKLAEIDVLTGRVDEGLTWNDRELALARYSEPAREPWILIERGSLLQKAGRDNDGEKAYREAMAIGEKLRDVRSIGAAQSELGCFITTPETTGRRRRTSRKRSRFFRS